MVINNLHEKKHAKACVIWMHGLGADSSDMKGLAKQLAVSSTGLHHVFLDAPVRPVTINGGMSMRAWYDIYAMEFTSREDQEGVLQSQRLILETVDLQLQAGFKPSQIFLAGFSQGGAMALYTALHYQGVLGGVIALSAYIPLLRECQGPGLSKNTPMFLATGQFDTIVLPGWTGLSKQWLEKQGYNAIFCKEYPMEHAVCSEEIHDVSAWLSKQMKEL